MSIVIAIKKDDTVYFGADTQRTAGLSKQNCLCESNFKVTKYKNGVLLNYSANFSTPYEGYRLAINGTHGRLEALEFNNRGNDALEHPWNDQRFVEYYPIFGGKERVHVLGGEGGHGGGDPLILEDIFLGEDPDRKFDILAKSVDGLRAISVGDAVFTSIEDGQVQDLTSFMR